MFAMLATKISSLIRLVLHNLPQLVVQYTDILKVCATSTKSFCFDAHVHYFEPQFMGPAVEFVAKAFLGKPVQNTQVSGNDPWTADASLKGADGSPSYPAKVPAKAAFLGLI
jgi:hypothetical protein